MAGYLLQGHFQLTIVFRGLLTPLTSGASTRLLSSSIMSPLSSATLQQLDAFLLTHSYAAGFTPSQLDFKILANIGGKDLTII